jgi:hypothetical protein
MSVTLTTAARNAACNAIVDLVDAGAGAGTLVFYLANGSTEVATCTFSDPAFGNSGAVNPGEAVASAITSDTSATGNASAATVAKFLDSNATEVLSCSVGIGSGDIQLTNNVIAAGETVAITALTVTVPA